MSLSPAITKMIVDLGLGDRIVAHGAYDPVAPEGLDVVGHLYHLDYEKLIAIRPTHIFMQPGTPGVPARLTQLAGTHGWRLHHYVIHRIDDVLRALHVPGGSGATPGVGRVLERDAQAEALAARIRRELDQLGALTRDRSPPGVLLLIGLQPLTAVGPETFLDEMLAFAGGRNVLADAARPYPSVDRERLLHMAPDVIVIVRSTKSNLDAPDPRPQRFLSGLAVPAVEKGRVVTLVDEVALLPSTSMSRIAGQLARLLHPDLAARIDDILKGGVEQRGDDGHE